MATGQSGSKPKRKPASSKPKRKPASSKPKRKPASSPATSAAQAIQPGDVVGGDKVEGDKITISDADHSAIAVGDGATAILTIIERALSAVEVADQAEAQATRRLGEALKIYVQSLAELAELGKNQAARPNPYKALLSYELQDAPLFFGRDQNCTELLGALDQGRLTVLYAESGAGKTSLLKAGLMSRLVARGDVPVYIRPRDTSVPFRLKSTLLPALNETPILEDDSLRDFLWRATKLLPDRKLVVLLDQFEDVFDLQSVAERTAFGKELADCLDDQTLRVRWVVSLRQEYFVRFGEFKQVKEPFGNVVSLPRMNKEQAREVIVGPSRLKRVNWEQTVTDQVLAELAAGDSGILPVQLQLVCAELFERSASHAITYSTYQEAGGVKGIVNSYLNTVLDRQIAVEQRKAALLLLEKLAAAQPEMRLTKESLAELVRGDHVAGTVVDEVLKQLRDAFLVRMEVVNGIEMVELAHRYLLEQLQPDVATREVVAARQLLDRAVADFEQKRLLLSAEKLAIIEAQWTNLGVDDTSTAARLRKESASRLARQRAGVSLGIGAVVVLVVVAVISFVSLGAAQNELGNIQATSTVVAGYLATEQANVAFATRALGEIGATATVVTQKQHAAETAAVRAVATAQAAETLATDAESRAAVASVALEQWFDRTGVVPVGKEPYALVMGGDSLWVANSKSNTVQQIDPDTGVVTAKIEVGDSPVALAWDGSSLWVANSYSNTVQQIDPIQRVVTATIDVGRNPYALAWDGSSLWVANRFSNTVEQIDVGLKAVTATIAVGDKPVALAWDGSSLWVANRNDKTVEQIDVGLKTVTATIAVKAPQALAWDGSSLWVANDVDNTVQKIDPDQKTGVKEIPVGDAPIALTWDGVSLWVANSYSNTIQQIDPGQVAVVATIDVVSPQALAWDGVSLWVANSHSNTVQRMDPGQDAVVATIDVGHHPYALAWGGSSLWVATSDINTVQQIDPDKGGVEKIEVGNIPQALVWDGGSMWVANSFDNTVQKIDPDSHTAGEKIGVGDRPVALAWGGGSLWVANSLDNTVDRIDPGQKRAIKTIPVFGDTPNALAWDGSSLWVAYRFSNTVDQIDPSQEAVVATIPVTSPVALVWDGDSLWGAYTSGSSSAIQQIDPNQGAVVATVAVGDTPNALAWDGSSLWVAYGMGDTVQQIDTVQKKVVATIKVGNAPWALAWGGGSLWVANNADNTVQQINARSLNLLQQARQLAQEKGTVP
jgi:YVTN family beta-propeller protein